MQHGQSRICRNAGRFSGIDPLFKDLIAKTGARALKTDLVLGSVTGNGLTREAGADAGVFGKYTFCVGNTYMLNNIRNTADELNDLR